MKFVPPITFISSHIIMTKYHEICPADYMIDPFVSAGNISSNYSSTLVINVISKVSSG
jgi:hypothetical protein